jgi:hypothetical protein
LIAKARAAFYPAVVFAVNLFVCWRYFRAEYTNQLPSIEGVFIALEEYIRRHWPTYDWFSMWYGGMPFTRVYQPGLHYATAMFSSVTGLSVASAYHALTAITYSLGGVAFYFLAKALTHQPVTSFCSALLFSLFSPSTLLVPVVRHDVGGVFNPRRLQALTIYGEGPNITGLGLGMCALAALHIALRRRTALTTCIAAVAVAAVPAVSWPATVALTIAILCYLAAVDWRDLRAALPRVAAIGVLAFGFASPFAPPSTILGTFAQANVMDDAPTPGPGRWISFVLLFVCLGVVRAVLHWRKAPFALRFPVLWAIFTGWFVIAVSAFGIRMIPYPMRFHLAMEIPILLTVGFVLHFLTERWPGVGFVAVAAVLIFCAVQIRPYRQFSRVAFQKIDISKTPEYDLAKWADAHMQGQRIYTRGTFGFWLNAFTETPQSSGFFDQSISNFEDRIASYVTAAGYRSDQESADYSLLWLKAWAADAIQLGGPNTADFYKDDQFPERFRGVLPVVWSRGDDFVYRVPERTEGLARVVRARDLVKHAPANGIDVAELRPFVQALDDSSLPQARFHWQGANAAQISGSFAPDQVLAVAINYDPGWMATVNGHAVPLRADGLGLIAIEPNCSGPCTVEMHWSQRWEPAFVLTMFLLALGISVIWCWITRYRGNPGSDLRAAQPA